MRSALLMIALTCICGCDDGGGSLIEWQDTSTGITVRVETDPGPVKLNSSLTVERDETTHQTTIDDDARWGRLSLVRYDDWLLVLNDDFALAGYDFRSGALYGEYDWEELPFLVHEGQGRIVASRQVGNTAMLPANYPIPRAATKATAP